MNIWTTLLFSDLLSGHGEPVPISGIIRHQGRIHPGRSANPSQDQSKFEVLFGKLGRHVIRTKEDKDNPSCYQRSVQKPASLMGSMYIEKSRGPKTDPCGTPYFTGITLDSSPFKSTKWYRSDSVECSTKIK
ncbi:hypothetical protein QTP70_005163 [Hemibagrus guttatus]|uniref:Uncharacterized protein n=1 Tax=Hemibagrus guttatus TaxID=175788 RepID=A0AAE0RAD0_9TELE|nr:hypothetical protein QTP70_005163 [Hemibagrus guttatus]